MIGEHLLTILIVTPFAAAAIALLVPASSAHAWKWIALTVNVIQLSLLVMIIGEFAGGSGPRWLIEQNAWITLDMGSLGTFRAEYLVGLDGLSLPLVGLCIGVLLIATISSWNVNRQPKGYFILLLVLNGAIIGTFCAFDLLLFYLFFEFTLLPMYFLIGIWGGKGREYASIKFFLYTLLGSILILLVIIALYLSSSVPAGGEIQHTFNLLRLLDPGSLADGSVLHPGSGWTLWSYSARYWAFLLLLIGFGIKLPIVPFHTWLPDAHVEASTPISVVLAALLLKIGGYGLIRMAYPLFPDAGLHFGWLVGFMGMVSILYGALNALASKDLKRLIAYSSVSHMGFVLLGIASMSAEGLSGAIFQMTSHGLITSMLFLIAGVLNDRSGDRAIANYSGLSSKMPVYTGFVLVAFFAALGLPGFSGFIGEVMVLLGAFRSSYVPTWMAVLSTTGLLFGAGYCLWTIQRMFFGPFASRVAPSSLADLDRMEKVTLVPLSILTVVLGIFPQILIQFINPFAQQFIDLINRSGVSP